MRRHVLLAHALAQVMTQALSQPPRVYKHQRRPVLLHQLYQAVVDRVPHLVRGHRPQRHRWNFDREVKLPLVANVDDDRIRTPASRQKVRDILDRFLGG